MKVYVSIILFILSSISLSAQDRSIVKGSVSNEYHEYLIGATIVLYAEKDTTKIISYAIANEKGEFSLTLEEVSGKYIKISYLGYKSKKVSLSSERSYYPIVLEESHKSLEEVIVSASAIRDTVSLKNDTLKFSDNTKLKEILKDNEGIEITEENGIKFMGVPINKILINKKEVFVNQNSIALENITSEMVDEIQIINNYKNKFNVDFDNFNEMVLNVDVKRKFKGVIKNIIELGLGISRAYTLEGKSFLFSDQLNVFLTQNTNSILNKPQNTSEITNRQHNSSSFYNENVSSISQGFKEVKEDNYNNSYLLIKKENNKSLLEANIGFNYSSQQLEKRILIDDSQDLISEELTSVSQRGKMFYTDLNFTALVFKDFSLNLFSNIDLVDNNLDWLNTKEVFRENSFISNTFRGSGNHVLKNGLNTRKIFNQKWLWENNVEYVYENTGNNFLNDLDDVNQTIDYANKQLNLSSSLFYQKTSILNYGLNLEFSGLNENISDLRESVDNPINRSYNRLKGSFLVKGQNSKLNYFVNIGSQSFLFQNESYNRTTLPVSTSFNYKFSGRKTFNFSYENNYLVEDLQNSMDSLFVNFTTLVVSNDISGNIQQKQNLTLNYNITNISKSKNISFLAAGSMDNNFSQISLIDASSNINMYQRMIFDERRTLFLEHRYSKGFYFSKNDHKLQLGYKVSGSFTESEVIQNNNLLPLYTEQFDIGMNLAFIPQKLFFTEIAFKSSYSKNNISIDKQRVNAIDLNRNLIFMSKSDGNHIYSIQFYHEIFKSQSETIIRNDFDLTYRFYINKDTSLFMTGKSILNLLNINQNEGDLTTNSINGLNITTINNNTFGYLILGVQFKI